jgi:hypothetical protein
MKDDRFEIKCGVMIAIFASFLAIMQLGSAESEEAMTIAYAEKTNAYGWYNAKSIKQNLVEGQRDTLTFLLESGAITRELTGATQKNVEALELKAARYKAEKKEILLGSAAVGEENWTDLSDDSRGTIVGAKEWEKNAETYGAVNEVFDLSNLILQICLVISAICLMVQSTKSRAIFFTSAILIGLVGSGIGVKAVFEFIALSS